ncbi:hypothetical protein [Bifidobacterium biavatii]|nr:hypothetical protein [Bifidobacterium biavatii]
MNKTVALTTADGLRMIAGMSFAVAMADVVADATVNAVPVMFRRRPPP